MKKNLLAILPILFILSAPAQTYNGVYADTNNVVLPGFTIAASQVTGVVPTGNLSSNVMMWSGIASTGVFGVRIFGSNVVANAVIVSNVNGTVGITNGTVSTTSNVMVGGTLYASTNLTTPAVYSQVFGGTNDGISGANLANSAVFGGYGNTADGYIGGGGTPFVANVAVGGELNICGGLSMATLGGQANHLDTGGWGAIVGGRTNQNYQESSVILGGMNNTASVGYPINARNNLILGGHNNLVYSGYGPSNCIVGGAYAQAFYVSTFVWADDQGTTTFSTATNNQFLIRAQNGVGVNTNYSGTNALRVFGNTDTSTLSLNGVDLFTAIPLINASNALYTLLTFNLNTASNALQTQISTTIVSNTLITVSNQVVANAATMTNYMTAASNALTAKINLVTAEKAFSFSLPATYSTMGIGFNTPLMPDGNYSVAILAEDQNTACSPLKPWITSKTSSGFTINVGYATNAYNLNWECVIKENSQ